jgi:hypothetical protein
MMDIFGWDIGGVHLKAARLSFDGERLAGVRCSVRYFEVWRDPAGLAEALRGIRSELGGGHARHALTMTAELADCFTGKAEGVRGVVGAARRALEGEDLRFWNVSGRFETTEGGMERPLGLAAANWLATAQVAAQAVSDGLLVDAGSTTSDLVPLAGGAPAPAALDDTGRLSSGELVYMGVLRTPPAALAPEVPLRGGWCRLSPEPFAFSADVYLALGRITPDQVTFPTADGHPANRRAALARMARLLCADLDALGEEPVVEAARFLESAQIGALERAARQVLSRTAGAADVGGEGGPSPVVVATGVGRFLAARLSARLERPCRDLSTLIPLADPQAAPATCVALLLAAETLGVPVSTWLLPA